jgi:outer membrane protein assembly factor BamB
LNLDNGSVAWQSRLGSSAPQVFESTDDFLVALQREEYRLANLVALDATTGRLVYRRTLPRDNGVGIANFALGADGMLVFVTPDRLVGKDLHDPSSQPTFQTDRGTSEGMVFANTVQPGQLVIADGRVLVWSLAGTQQQSVRAFSLADGKPMKYLDPKTKKETQARFNPEAGTSPGTIRVVGSKLYLVGQRNLVCYDLETGAKQWSRYVTNRKEPWSCREVLVGRDYLIAIDEVGANGAKLQLNCFNRTRLPDGVESGTYDYAPELQTPGGFAIGQWQPISGGLAVRTQKNKLIVLRGQRNTAP